MSDETAPQPRIKVTWLIGTAAAFALFAVIGAYSSRMTWNYPDYDQERAAQRYDTLAKVRQAESKLINPVDAQGKPTAEWVDQTKGTLRIQIEEAMAGEIDTLKAKPVAMGAAIPVIAPAAPAATAVAPVTGATNAAPAKPAAPGAKTGAEPAPATTKPNP